MNIAPGCNMFREEKVGIKKIKTLAHAYDLY